MIKFSELEEIGSSQLLANTTAIIPVSTGNASFVTFKTTISNIGNYIFSNAGNILSSSIVTTNANVTNNLITTNISLGNISGTTSASNPNQNKSRITVRPSMDLNGNGSVGAADLLAWLKIITGASGGSVNSYNNVPFIVQHVDKPATGIMITNNSYLNESLDSTSGTKGQIYITSGGSDGFLTSWIRVGEDDYQPGDIFIKGSTVNVAGGITMQQQSYVTSTIDNFSGGTGFGLTQAFNVSGALSINNSAYIGGNTFVRSLVVGNVSTAANGWIYTANLAANGWVYTTNLVANSVSTGNLEVNSNVFLNAGVVSVGNIAGTRSRLVPGSNNSRLRVRPTMDLNGSGSVSAGDVLNWLQVITGASSVNSYTNSPFVIQHVDKSATGILITNNSYLSESLDSTTTAQGQIYITTGSSTGTIASYIRVGDDEGFPGNIYMKAITVNISGNVTPNNINVSSNASIGNSFFTNNILLGNSSTDVINSSDTTPDPTKSVTTIDTTGGPLSATLSSDTTNGMVKTFHMVTDGGDLTLTVTNAGWKGGASGTITFNDQGDGCILLFLSGSWHMIGNNGTVTA